MGALTVYVFFFFWLIVTQILYVTYVMEDTDSSE